MQLNKVEVNVSKDILQESIELLKEALIELQQNNSDEHFVENLKLLQESVRQLKYLFIRKCLVIGISQNDIAKKLNLSAGRISQLISEYKLRDEPKS